MPELPEVESVRVALAGELAGRRVEDVRLNDARCAARPAAEAFRDGLRGRAFTKLGRRGKFLLAALDDGGRLAVHLRMTGRLLLAEAGEADALSIEHMDDLWVVSGKWMQQLIADINFADYESRMYFDRQLRKSGLFDRLEEMGIEDGDTVSIYDFEFEYER